MRRSLRPQTGFLLSILFAVAPVGFATIRAVTTGSDVRMLWMAFASYVGTILVMAMARARGRTRKDALVVALSVLGSATVLAALTAYLLGATAAAGIWPVAFVLAFCCAMSCALGMLSRPQAV